MKLDASSKRLVNSVSYIVIGFLGVYIAVYQSAVTDIMAAFDIDAGSMGLVISMHFAGSFLLPIALGELGDRVSTKPVLLLAFSILIVGLVLVIFGRHVVLFAVGSILVGGGFAVIEGLLSGLLTVANPERVNAVMNISQMFFCIGAVCGPLLGYAIRMIGLGWRNTYFLLVIAFFICMLLIACMTVPTIISAKIKGLQLSQLLKNRTFVLLLVSIFLYVGIEEGTAFWVTSYVKVAISPAISGVYFISVYWLGMAVGRYFSSRINGGHPSWVLAGVALACLLLVGMLAYHNAWWIIACFFFIGFGFAPAWPVLMMMASMKFPKHINTTMGAMMSLGAAGGIVVPFALGRISADKNTLSAFILLPVLLIALIGFILLVSRHIMEKNNINV